MNASALATSYCMNDPTKIAPFVCHGPCEDGAENQCVPSCTSDADCPLPGSYCMIDPHKQPPFVCHVPNPPEDCPPVCIFACVIGDSCQADEQGCFGCMPAPAPSPSPTPSPPPSPEPSPSPAPFPCGCEADSDCPAGSYCMNDPTKVAPYVCHGTVSSTCICITDKDCPGGSYCMNDPTKVAPYVCHSSA